VEAFLVKKVAVSINCTIDADGNIQPNSIKWKDGRRWEIDRVLHTCRSPDSSFDGIRYTVLIGGVEKYLYQSDSHWYVGLSS